jgi:hypothetical protein
MIFSIQKLFCQICRVEFETDFNLRGGYGANKSCCNKKCFREWQWRRALAIIGKDYYPDPNPEDNEL